MKLWIRTQDKTKLMEAEELIIKEVVKTDANNVNGYKQEVVGCNICVGYIPVALYKTKERALQVLDEIQNALVGKVEVKQSKSKKEDGILEAQPFNIKPLNQNCVVYELPKE